MSSLVSIPGPPHRERPANIQNERMASGSFLELRTQGSPKRGLRPQLGFKMERKNGGSTRNV